MLKLIKILGIVFLLLFIFSFIGFALKSIPLQFVDRTQALLPENSKNSQIAAVFPAVSAPFTFTKNLQIKDINEDVHHLQIFLNKDPDTKIALSGPGSPRNETYKFGLATYAAVKKFQEKYRSEILTPSGLKAPIGFVGNLTRAKINALESAQSLTTTVSTPVIALKQPISNPLCGNNVLDPGEVCEVGPDGKFLTADDNVGGKTCQSFGYTRGAVYCGLDCKTFDTGMCLYNEKDLQNMTHTATQTTQTPAQPQTNRQAKINQLVDGYLIGGSSNAAADRSVGNVKAAGGWINFVNNAIKPDIAWGIKRIEIHNPFGYPPGEQMEFDQYLNAKAAGLTWLTDGFVEAWKPITASGVEVIAYLGNPKNEPEFSALPRDQWFERFWASVQPLLDAGITSIGIDNSSSSGENSIEFEGLNALKSRGIKVYVEARPSKAYPNLWPYNIFSTSEFWYRSDPALYADAASWATPDNFLTGEIMLMYNSLPPAGHDWSDYSVWALPDIKKILAEGHSAVVSVWHFLNDPVSKKVTIDDLIN